MPEINLKDYFNRLNGLLTQNAADEVIHHARHILRYYPKNVQVYRFLGRALVFIGRYDEGQAALRRVLAVLPDDLIAHVALGEVYERTNRCDEAIFHLERALDQRPSDKDLLDALRVLYHRCRQTGQLKIQMTAGAVARQHWRSGTPDYAIETLRAALKSSPDRVDLRLLLAQILWETGREDEAADAALDVLKTLPDCLEANRILAELWLNYDRPSDAQRFVNRVESVDPYLALELVQKSPAEPDAFRVEELDYHRSASAEAVTARPDWLRDLSAAAVVEGVADEPPRTVEDEWTSWSSAMLTSENLPPDAPPAQVADDLDWLSSFPVRVEEDAGAAPTLAVSDSDLDALFSTNSLSPSFTEAYNAPEAPYTPPSAPDDADPFAWMSGAGAELSLDPQPQAIDEPDFDDLFTAPSQQPIPSQDENPLAWMGQYDDDMLVADSPVESSPAQDEGWYAGGFSPALEADSALPDPDAPADEEDGLAWLRGSMPDALVTDSSAADAALDDFSMFDPDQQAMPPATPPPAAPSGMRGLTAILNEGNFDWIQASEASPASEEDMDDWLNQFSPEAARPAAPTDTPDWLAAMDENAQPEQISAVYDPNPEEQEWMSEPEPRSDQQPEEALPGDDGLDWLSEFQPEGAQPLTPPPSEDDAFSFADMAAPEQPIDDDAAWDAVMNAAAEPDAAFSLSDLMNDAGADALSESSDAIPEWLLEAAPQPEESAGDEPVETALDWLNEEAISASEAQVAAGFDAGLNGLDDLDTINLFSPAATPAVSEPEEEFSLEGILDDADDAGVPVAADSEPVPDWLLEVQPPATFTPETTTSGMETIDNAAAMSNWLEALPDSDMSDPVAVAAAADLAGVDAVSDDFSWLTDSQIDAPDTGTVPADPVAAADYDALVDAFDFSGAEELAETAMPGDQAVETPVDDFAAMFASLDAEADQQSAGGETAEALFANLEDEAAVPVTEVESLDDVLAGLELGDDALTPTDDVTGSLDDLFMPVEDALSAEAEAIANDESLMAAEPDSFDDLFGEVEPLTDAEQAAEIALDAEAEAIVPDEMPLPQESDELFESDMIDQDAAPVTAYNVLDDEAEAESAADADDGAEVEEQLYEEQLYDEDDVFTTETPVNTPDWLNALVPGLDVDTTAQDYVLPDEEFDLIEEPLLPADSTSTNSEFGWLNAIIDEELSNSRPIARFSFSRPPAWARRAEPTAQEDDALPDWVDDGE